MLFACLYASEGGPIGFVWWALPVWLRTAGVSPGEIARVVALAGWPWALKVLWAPAIDVLQGTRFGLRGWILASQAIMALTLAPLIVVDPVADLDALVLLLVVHALAASTQDAAIDTLAIRTVPETERGAINGWMQVGMLGARAAFGGGAVLLAARIGRPAVVVLLMAVVLTPGLSLLRRRNAPPPPGDGRAVGRHLRALLRTPRTLVGFAFASLAGAGFESLASLAGPLLLDRGVVEDDVGWFFLLPVVACMGAGALLGGWAADRLGRRRTTLFFEALTALLVASVGLAAILVPPEVGGTPFVVLLAAVYVAAGLTTAALYALLMDQTDPRVAATQFCAFMAGINLCYVWSTRLLGALVDRWDYGPAICLMAGLSLVALPLLRWLPESARRDEAPS